ncbi:MAG: ORF6N domain-containing protein [Acidobacteria bacterium]|nr:ORF6N domain-containing protein [Acidobacteriota bacterium]
MVPKGLTIAVEEIDSLIREIRGNRVMLDVDLAANYDVTNKALNQAVKRNADRFPKDFAFQLTADELETMRSQIVTGSQKHRNPRFLPTVFTEHGAIMAATILNSPRAVLMSVFVVRAFVKMRAVLAGSRELALKLAALEKELKERLDVHEVAIVAVLQRIMEIIDPPRQPEPPRGKRIGFGVEEGRARYHFSRHKKLP